MMRCLAVMCTVGFPLSATAQGKHYPVFDSCVEKSESNIEELKWFAEAGELPGRPSLRA